MSWPGSVHARRDSIKARPSRSRCSSAKVAIRLDVLFVETARSFKRVAPSRYRPTDSSEWRRSSGYREGQLARQVRPRPAID